MKIFQGFIFCSFLWAQSGYGDAFMNIGVSPRIIGLAQTVVALNDEPAATYINPSSSGFMKNKMVYGMLINQFNLAEYISAGMIIPKNEKYQFGIHVVSLYVDNILLRPDLHSIADMEVRRDTIRHLVSQGFASFSDWETAMILNISGNIQKEIDLGWQMTAFNVDIPIGMNLKIIHKNLGDLTGNGIGLDFGTMLTTDLESIFYYDWLGELTLGLSVNNILGTRIYWSSEHGDLIPMQTLMGLNYHKQMVRWPVAYSFLYQVNSIYKNEAQMGTEITMFNKVQVRMGTRLNQIQGGVGFVFKSNQKQISIDYSFGSHDLGNSHRFGGSIRF